MDDDLDIRLREGRVDSEQSARQRSFSSHHSDRRWTASSWIFQRLAVHVFSWRCTDAFVAAERTASRDSKRRRGGVVKRAQTSRVYIPSGLRCTVSPRFGLQRDCKMCMMWLAHGKKKSPLGREVHWNRLQANLTTIRPTTSLHSSHSFDCSPSMTLPSKSRAKLQR